jgi:hypothetical protein
MNNRQEKASSLFSVAPCFSFDVPDLKDAKTLLDELT